MIKGNSNFKGTKDLKEYPRQRRKQQKDTSIIKSTSRIDRCVSVLIKEERKKRNISGVFIAKKIGLTPQQYYKYENGINRISIGRLYHIAKILNVSVHNLLPLGE